MRVNFRKNRMRGIIAIDCDNIAVQGAVTIRPVYYMRYGRFLCIDSIDEDSYRQTEIVEQTDALETSELSRALKVNGFTVHTCQIIPTWRTV